MRLKTKEFNCESKLERGVIYLGTSMKAAFLQLNSSVLIVILLTTKRHNCSSALLNGKKYCRIRMEKNTVERGLNWGREMF